METLSPYTEVVTTTNGDFEELPPLQVVDFVVIGVYLGFIVLVGIIVSRL